jgi:hypothetical protein
VHLAGREGDEAELDGLDAELRLDRVDGVEDEALPEEAGTRAASAPASATTTRLLRTATRPYRPPASASAWRQSMTTWSGVAPTRTGTCDPGNSRGSASAGVGLPTWVW